MGKKKEKQADPTPDSDAPVSPDLPADEDPFAELRTTIDQLEDKLMRARADYDNLQKRHAREADLERERQKARIVEPFLQVFEFASMAAAEAEKSPGALADGVKMLVREFERQLEELGVKTIGVVGDAFDASSHEATGEQQVDGVAPGNISVVVKPGYRLGDRVLRYARVLVQPATRSDESE